MALQNRYKKKVSSPAGMAGDARRWLNLHQLAEYTGAHPNAVRELVRSGKLKKRTVGHTWLVDRLDVDAFLETAA